MVASKAPLRQRPLVLKCRLRHPFCPRRKRLHRLRQVTKMVQRRLRLILKAVLCLRMKLRLRHPKLMKHLRPRLPKRLKPSIRPATNLRWALKALVAQSVIWPKV